MADIQLSQIVKEQRAFFESGKTLDHKFRKDNTLRSCTAETSMKICGKKNTTIYFLRAVKTSEGSYTKKPPNTKENGNAILPVFADETTTIICKEENANS